MDPITLSHDSFQTQTAHSEFGGAFSIRMSFVVRHFGHGGDINGITNAQNGNKIKIGKTVAFHLAKWWFCHHPAAW